MSVFDFTEAREDAAAYLLFDTCTIVTITSGTDDGGAPTQTETSATSACAFNQASARELQGDVVKERGSYRLKLPRDAEIGPTSEVLFSGRRYRVVWTPPLANIGLTRLVGLEDA